MRNITKTFGKNETVVLKIFTGNNYRDTDCVIENTFMQGKKMCYLLRNKQLNAFNNPIYFGAPQYYISYCNSESQPQDGLYAMAAEYLPELKAEVITVSKGKRYSLMEMHINAQSIPRLEIGTDSGLSVYEDVKYFDFLWLPGKINLINVYAWTKIPEFKEESNEQV